MMIQPASPPSADRRPAACVRRCRPGGAAALGLVLLVALSGAADAVEVRSFRAAEPSDFLAGTLDGVSLGPLGTLRLARALDQVATVEEPFLLSAAAAGDAWVVGTGNSGRVLRISADGAVAELFAAEEPEVFAVRVEGDVVYAAASPEARLYRHDLTSGETEMILATGEEYVWAIDRERGESGRLVLGTGLDGRLLAFDEESGSMEVLYDTDDLHVRSVLVRDDDILIGTVGEGRILSLRRGDGDAAGELVGRTLFDAAQPEITALTPGPDGSFFAAAVASEASLAQLQQGSDDDEEDSSPASPPPTGTRPAGFDGARSLVLRIGADGSVETPGSFDKETVYSLLWTPATDGTSEQGVLWVATGQDGKLYRSRGEEMVLERDLDQLQLISLLPDGDGLAIATTNGAALYRTSDRDRDTGTFTSKVLDTRFPSRFGTLHHESVVPEGARVEFALRTGQSAFPDETWSPWVVPGERSEVGAAGLPDLDLGQVPRGRYLQWRATLSSGGGGGPQLSVVEISYRQENRRPEITELEVLSPGRILVASSFNPANQVFEPMSPSRDGIFTSLDDPAEDDSRTKELWKVGYRTVRWKAEDPNGDALRYELALRREGTERWYPVAADIDGTSWGFDTTVLPDGLYRVRLRAHDGEANDDAERRLAERVSGIVVIDHSPPRITSREGRGPVRVTVTDGLSPLRTIEVSVDAGSWRDLVPVDGMVDARSETVSVEIPEDAGMVLLRVSDVAFNTAVVALDGAGDG